MGEKFQANAFDGTGSFSIPITTSPGRAGFGPQLNLSFSSGNGNSPFGLGWNLSIPSISRKTDKGLPRYDDEDMFVISSAEDLVPVDPEYSFGTGSSRRGSYTVKQYRPRVESLFACIERWTREITINGKAQTDEHWRVVTKDNLTSLYGRTKNARIYNPDPEKQEHVFQWLLEETFDAKGNHVLYEYAQDDAAQIPIQIFEENRTASQRYIRRIFYGNLPTAVPLTHSDGSEIGISRQASSPADPSRHASRHYSLEAVFDYGDWQLPFDLSLEKIQHQGYRNPSSAPEVFGDGSGTTISTPVRGDAFSSYRAGFEVRTRRLCRRVVMYHHFEGMTNPLPVRATCFEHKPAVYSLLSLLQSVTVAGFRAETIRSHPALVQRALPSLNLEYSEFRPKEQRFLTMTARDGMMPPFSLLHPEFTIVDLFGNGMPGVLHAGTQGYVYWRNLGDGHLDVSFPVAKPSSLATMPVGLSLADPGVTFGDTNGDGRVELIVQSGAVHGRFESLPEGGWKTFQAFPPQPTFDPADPNLRRVDLTGDGLPDMLVTRDHHFLWYQNLGDGGFSGPKEIRRIRSDYDNEFPDIFFNDTSGRIRLADMTGDGLADIVRIHHGTVEYWPNLGYGQFGRKITMEVPDAPSLETLFDPSRLFLVDLDGTGCADLVYVGSDQVKFWFNQSGNTWSNPEEIHGTPFAPTGTGLEFADIFGTGTATLVWSRDIGAIPGGNYFALDFCGGVKPHLLVGMRNGLGAINRITYSPSTRFALKDEAAGKPWHTTLPFPVHVVEKVETIDTISRCRHTSSYRYSHGFFDGRDREFRGFGYVEQTDTEAFDDFERSTVNGDAAQNAAKASHLPPVRTKTWFHTGAWLESEPLATKYRGEYWRGDQSAMTLADHDLPNDPEAFRALRGAVLRSEVYALDSDPLNAPGSKALLPFSVTDNRHRVQQLQPIGPNKHGIFLASVAESLTHHYERNPDDPRIAHNISFPPDNFGNITDTVAVAYPRRTPDPEVPEQAETKIVFTKSDLIINADALNAWLVGIPVQVRIFELTGVVPSGAKGKFEENDFTPLIVDLARSSNRNAPFPSGTWKHFHQVPPQSASSKRLIEWTRNYFRKDSAADDLDPNRMLTNRLPLGSIEPLALPFETLKAVFTKGLVNQVYDSRVDESIINRAGYITESDVSDHWWIPSPRSTYSAAQFYLTTQTIDPFGGITSTNYDVYVLLAEKSVDAIGNETKARNDYRTLQPNRITSPNGHISEVAFDALGRVVATAISSQSGEGDTLAGFEPDLTQAQIRSFVGDPRTEAAGLLQGASTRLVYDLSVEPVFHATIARTEHHMVTTTPQVLLTFSYSDGFGRETQTKVQAESDTSGAPRWVGTGWTIYNNKSKPVRQFEPFFSVTHNFEFNIRQGVSPYLFYDPLTRVVATLKPDHSWEKVVFDPWKQTTYDIHDTVLIADPQTDSDVGLFFKILDKSEWSPTWHALRMEPNHTVAFAKQYPDSATRESETDAAKKAEIHFNSPSVVHLDCLARPVLSIVDLISKKLKTRTSYDTQGNVRTITDPRGIVAFTHEFDMAKRQLSVQSVDAGHSRLLPDALGAPLFSWDAIGHRVLALFDVLHRPTDRWLLKPGESRYRLTQKTIYGEATGTPAGASLRGQVWKVFDGAGLAQNEQFDFKGNLESATRTLWADPKSQPEWGQTTDPYAFVFNEAAASSLLDTGHRYRTESRYDALNRVTSTTTPDKSVQSFYFNEANLLKSVTLRHRGAPLKTIVENIDYNAKAQRTRIKYGNGVATDYTYDNLTFRLQKLLTRRNSGNHNLLQDLNYTYDAVGNITRIRDDAHQTVYFAGQKVDPVSDYKYDALYRLVEATGREHISFGACHYREGGKQQTEYIPTNAKGQPISNAQALMNYTQCYKYDDGGNIKEIRQLRGGTTHWVRTQTQEATSNRIKRSRAGCKGEGINLTHDDNGNLLKLAHMPKMEWNDRNQLIAAQLNESTVNPDRARYQYDAAGQRMRKTITRNARVEERIYLGGFEIFVVHNGSGAVERWETLHVADGEKCIAIVETKTSPVDANQILEKLTRFQFGNHLGSAVLEIDDSSSARIISYEEYAPYGETAYIAGQNLSEVRRKRYRYSGKERDSESGLCYYGARYLAPWMGRWTNCDPAGPIDGLNCFAFVRANPLAFRDPHGMASNPTGEQTVPEIPDFRLKSQYFDFGEEDRTEWSRGWGNIAWGGVSVGGGALALTGAAAAFATGGMAIPVLLGAAAVLGMGGGSAAIIAGSAQRITTNRRSAAEDMQTNAGVSLMLQLTSSIPALLGGVIGGAAGNREGLETGLRYGMYTDLVLSLGGIAHGVRPAVAREIRFGNPVRRSYGWADRANGALKQNIWEAFGLANEPRVRFNPLLHGGSKEGPLLFAGRAEERQLAHFIAKKRYEGSPLLERLLNRPWNTKPLWRTEEMLSDSGAGRSWWATDYLTSQEAFLTPFSRFALGAPDWVIPIASLNAEVATTTLKLQIFE